MRKRLLLLIPLALLMVGCGRNANKKTSSKNNTTTSSNTATKTTITTKKSTSSVANNEEKAILLLNKNIEGAGSVIGGGSYDIGSTVTIKATANDNYVFLGWYNGTQLVSDQDEYEVTLDSDLVLTAKFELVSYALYVEKNIDDAGTITGTGFFKHGTSQTLTVTVNTGFRFVGWYDENNQYIDNNYSLTVEMLDETKIKAIFELDDYVLAINKNIAEAGTVTGSGTYEYGTTVTVSVTKTNAGYKFIGWKNSSGIVISTENNYSFTFNESTLLTAYFETEKYTITLVSDSVHGSVTGSGTYEYGSLITIYASPEQYYRFNGWKVNGEIISTDAEYTFTVEKNMELTGSFSLLMYNLTTINSDTTAGSCSNLTNEEYSASYEVELYVHPSVGRAFDGWYDEDDNFVSNDENYSFYLTRDITLTAKWGYIEYNVIINADNYSDQVTIAGSGKYRINDTMTFSIVFDEDKYLFDGWYLSARDNTLRAYGYTKTLDREFDGFTINWGIKDDTYNICFIAKVSKRYYDIELENSNSNAGTIDGSGSYKYNSYCTITATPNPGYIFDGWYDTSNELFSDKATYTFQIDKEDVKLTAKWKAYYSLNTSSNNANYGTCTKYTNELVLNGTSITLEATPKALCTFDGWYVNDERVETRTTYTFTMPESNYTCVAKFSTSTGLTPFTVTVDGDEVIITGFASGYEDTENVIIPDSATQIGAEAFMNNTKIKTLIIGNGVTVIKESAFQNTTLF